jgi:hypothetical protein
METFIIYLLKASAGIAAFHMTYRLLLSRDKNFVFNRFYLSGSVIASFLIPLVTFRKITYTTAPLPGPVVPEIIGGDTGVYASAGTPVISIIYLGIFGVYLAGVLFCLSKFGYACFLAMRINRRSTRCRISGTDVYVSDENIRAFTFLDKIVAGRNILGHPSLEMILAHEMVHAREKHFIDIIVAEILQITQWFNPFAGWHSLAVRENLEYRADDIAIRHSDPVSYQLTMLSLVNCRDRIPVFAGLNSSNIKKRIIMMKSKSNRFSGMARLAVIPVLAILILTLCREETVVLSYAEEDIPAALMPESSSENITASTQDNRQQPVQLVDEMRHFMAAGLRYPREAAESGIMGRVDLYVSVGSDGIVKGITERQPASGYVDIREIVVIGYGNRRDDPSGNPRVEFVRHPGHPVLVAEGRRLVQSFPVLDIPEVKGRIMKLSVNFILE